MADAVGQASGQATLAGAGQGIAPQPGGTSVAEVLGAGSSMESVLKTGLRLLSADQEVTFIPYVKVVLPFDGYVFWVKADLVSKSALIGSFVPNSVTQNQPRRVVTPAQPLTVRGSLHIATTNQQDADESFSVNRVVFTSESRVNDLNEISPQMMYLATIGDFRFNFSQRENFYKQADLYHYVGDAVYPVMETMIIDDLAGFDTRDIIVSNSLPIWLSLNKYMPMYPSFLVDDNLRPPYCAVHITGTRALQMAPRIDRKSNHWQLVTERVRLVVYGLRNFQALDFQDYVLGQSLSSNTFGVMNSPVMLDEKRTQTELSAIAMKKSMELDINYYQVTVRNLARQMILEAIPKLYVGGGVSVVELQ